MLPDSKLWYLREETELTIFSGGFHADKNKLRFSPKGLFLSSVLI